MHETYQKMIDSIRNVRLSTDEKETLWKNIDAYVKTHGVPEHPHPVQLFRPARRTLSPYMQLFERVGVFALVALVIFGGGTSLLAQNALPNNTLYSVKLATEGARSWLALTSEAKAYAEANRAAKRLDEAQALAMRGELSTSAQALIQENFNKHAQNVLKQIEALEAKDDLRLAVDVSKNFEALLAARSKSLAQTEKTELAVAESGDAIAMKTRVAPSAMMMVADMASLAPTPRSGIGRMVDSIEQNISASKKARKEVESRIPVSRDVEMKRLSAKDRRKDAVEQIEKLKIELEKSNAALPAPTLGFMAVPVPAIVNTSSAIEKATTLIKLADKQFEAKEYGLAFTLFRDAYDAAATAEHTLTSTNISESGKPIVLPGKNGTGTAAGTTLQSTSPVMVPASGGSSGGGGGRR